MMWWAYRHTNGSILLKRFFSAADIEEAYQSPFVKEVVGPFMAEDEQHARRFAEEKLQPRSNNANTSAAEALAGLTKKVEDALDHITAMESTDAIGKTIHLCIVLSLISIAATDVFTGDMPNEVWEGIKEAVNNNSREDMERFCRSIVKHTKDKVVGDLIQVLERAAEARGIKLIAQQTMNKPQ